MSVTIRSATLDDAQILLEWRNDLITRKASHSEDIVSFESHMVWLQASLADHLRRRIWVAEWQGKPIGTCRADKQNELWSLSWTLAPSARGQGLAIPMIQAVMDKTPGVLLAQVKEENLASQKVAQKLGFQLVNVKDGVLNYKCERPLG
ncbi:GNAT family N-acetyltransferase [Marinomonas epiphytica]